MKKQLFDSLTISPIAHIRTDFPEKFGIPRQGEIIPELPGKIVFEKEFRKEGILKGMEGFSHLWLIWGFSGFEKKKDFSPTIRPPKLGGNEKVGVFASRSPNRPNPIGLSAVRIQDISYDEKDSPVIYVTGVDLMDGTPIYDIKPYLPYCDSIPDALEGYTKETRDRRPLEVFIPDEMKKRFSEDKFRLLMKVLAGDPRPGFRHDEKIYGFPFAGAEVKFHVENEKRAIVDSIEPIKKQ